MKRVLIYIISALGAILVLTWISGWLWSYRLEVPEQPANATLKPSSEAPLGSMVLAQVEITIPTRFRIKHTEAIAGKGCVQAGTVKIHRGTWHWSKQVWRIETELRAFRPGQVDPGSLTIEFGNTLKSNDNHTHSVVIPGFVALPISVEKNTELKLADVATPHSKHFSPWWLLLAIPIVILVWWLLRHRQKVTPVLPSWELATQALKRLRIGLEQHEIPLEVGYIKLTDLVREYLEQRFHIPASSRTTPEFLSGMDGLSSPLPVESRPFLREFMTAADQVKFAKLPPNIQTLSDALDKAEQLVERTKLPSENTPQGQGGTS